MKSTNRSRIINSWVMYDWANSAFATTIMVVLLPIYYQSVAGVDLPGNKAVVYWGYTISIALLIAAVISPVLGAMADLQGAKKRYLIRFMFLGATGAGLLFFVRAGDWQMASLFFIMGNVGFATANVFYDSMLTHLVGSDELDRVSAKGYALGYLGGGLLLAVNVAMLYFAPADQVDLMYRWSFLSVAVWWLVFSIPLIRHVPESPAVNLGVEPARHPLAVSFKRLAETFRELRKYKQVLIFLAAMWLYTDGIGTIMKMAVIVGAEIGISQITLIGTILAVQFVGIPFAVLFGRLAEKTSPKQGIMIGLVVYAIISLLALRLKTDLEFFLLGMGLAMVQGGTQALTRSLAARMVPAKKSGEFFGFISVTIKFAGIIGPALFAFVGNATGRSRAGFWAVFVLFIVGMVGLSFVDEEEAIRVAQEEG